MPMLRVLTSIRESIISLLRILRSSGERLQGSCIGSRNGNLFLSALRSRLLNGLREESLMFLITALTGMFLHGEGIRLL